MKIINSSKQKIFSSLISFKQIARKFKFSLGVSRYDFFADGAQSLETEFVVNNLIKIRIRGDQSQREVKMLFRKI